ncbi:hypothetical protein PMPD1_0551 [Paramixta manurensis]|uniref:DUF2645 family protein n=1 Tax=Paramixta manurensis TaxID=2740817 RepID=A0A6M8U4I6_9GAMM|nr:hypothetical protein PMPD1_0551 [Erwiniaceae bacterium PD-1]
MNWKKFTITTLWFLLSIFMIAYLSYFKEEQYIDGDEVKTLCDAYRIFMVDDIRAFTAPLTLMLLLPFIWLTLRKKHRTLYLIVMTVILFAFWYWRFFGRLQLCLA